jgi:hypothetical protein
VSGEQIEVTPEPTPAEAEAIRRALEALGLLGRDASQGEAGVGSDPASAGVSDP